MRRMILPVAGLAVLVAAGCATDTSQLPRFQRVSSEEDAMQARVAKDDFPSAREAGLSMDKPKDNDAE